MLVEHRPSVEQVQRGDGGLLRFLDLWLGQFDAAHRDHPTHSKVSGNAAHTQPERPVQAVIQHHQYKQALAVVGHALCQTVVPNGCQEAQHGQGTEESCKHRCRKVREMV